MYVAYPEEPSCKLRSTLRGRRAPRKDARRLDKNRARRECFPHQRGNFAIDDFVRGYIAVNEIDPRYLRATRSGVVLFRIIAILTIRAT